MAATLALAATSHPQSFFFDDFDAGASPLWGNQEGSWFAADGVYDSLFPDNDPNTYSDLPFLLTNFSVDVDVNRLQDGGIWLRSSYEAGDPSSINGVLLVTGGYQRSGTGLYWHVVQGGSLSGVLNPVDGLFTSGVSNAHIRVEVVGDTYSAFVDGSTVPAASLVDDTFSSGHVGLYDYSDLQTFDNFNVVPEPASLLGASLGLILWRTRRKAAAA